MIPKSWKNFSFCEDYNTNEVSCSKGNASELRYLLGIQDPLCTVTRILVFVWLCFEIHGKCRKNRLQWREKFTLWRSFKSTRFRIKFFGRQIYLTSKREELNFSPDIKPCFSHHFVLRVIMLTLIIPNPSSSQARYHFWKSNANKNEYPLLIFPNEADFTPLAIINSKLPLDEYEDKNYKKNFIKVVLKSHEISWNF